MPIEVTVCDDCGVAYDVSVDECPVCDQRIASEVHVVSDDEDEDGGGLLAELFGAEDQLLTDREADILLGVVLLVIAAWAVLRVLGVL